MNTPAASTRQSTCALFFFSLTYTCNNEIIWKSRKVSLVLVIYSHEHHTRYSVKWIYFCWCICNFFARGKIARYTDIYTFTLPQALSRQNAGCVTFARAMHVAVYGYVLCVCIIRASCTFYARPNSQTSNQIFQRVSIFLSLKLFNCGNLFSRAGKTARNLNEMRYAIFLQFWLGNSSSISLLALHSRMPD